MTATGGAGATGAGATGGGGTGMGQAVRMVSVATSSPDLVLDQRQAFDAMARHYGAALSPKSMKVMEKVFAHPSIKRRRFALASVEEAIFEDPDARARRFTRWSVRLSAEAAGKALARAGLRAGDVASLVVNTCTGYICPGISTYVAQALGLGHDTRLYDLVGAGCGGAVPNLQLSSALAQSGDGRAAVCVSVEICTATFQMGDDLSLIVSNALFADGAGAAVISRGPASRGGLTLVDTQTLTAQHYREDIRYVHKGGQLHNQLSLALPRILARETPHVVNALLARHGLTRDHIRHWAIHPGGDKVISALQDALGLSDANVALTRAVLAAHGNVSSATVWYEMEHILSEGVSPGDWCVMVAAGAGLSIHAALLLA